MALVYFDGFDMYDGTGDFDDIPWLRQGLGTFSTSAGRRGGGACGGSYETRHCGVDLDYFGYEINPIILGVAIKPSGYGNSYNSQRAFLWFGNEGLSNQITLGSDGNGGIVVYRGSTNIVETGSGYIALDAWQYFEIELYLHDSLGYVIMRKNGNIILDTTDSSGAMLDTLNNASYPYINRIRWSGFGGDSLCYHDDCYILDTTGSKNNSFLGDVRVDKLLPNADGTYSDLTPSGGSSAQNYEMVDESYISDEDTTYNSGDVVGNKDSYKLEDLSSLNAKVYGMRTISTLRKDDAGTCKVQQFVRTEDSASPDVDVEAERTLGDSYESFHAFMEDYPLADSSQDEEWTEAKVNNMEIGIEITSMPGDSSS